MDKNIIQQIVAEVVAQLPLGDRYWMYMYLVINVAVVAAAASLAAWFGSFFKTKAQNFATKQDFDELLRQLRTNTNAVETIKSEIGQRDWARREWTNLRRIKLEALLDKMHDCDAFLGSRRQKALEGVVSPPERNPIIELDVLAALYFRELTSEVDQFSYECKMQHDTMIEIAIAIRDAHRDANKYAEKYARDAYNARVRVQEFIDARNALTAAASTLLERIMNVDERTRDDR